MGILTLIRHGQASFLSENYDRLSPLGHEQSARLGEYWNRLGVTFDRVILGPARRHRETGEQVAEVYRRAGTSWPAAEVVPELDEYAGFEAMRVFLPRLLERDAEIRAMEAAFRAAADRVESARIFERLFQRVTRMWVRGELSDAGVEPWAAFCARVQDGLGRVAAGAGKSARVAVFTSGGPIAVGLQAALDLTPMKTLEVSWASRNASFTEFLFSAERFSLSGFNAFPHLDEPRLVTYR